MNDANDISKNKYFKKFDIMYKREIKDTIIDAIKNNNKDKLEMLKIAIIIFLDTNCSEIIEAAIKYNDIMTISHLIKYDTEFDKVYLNDDTTVLHLCAKLNKHHLMKYFLNTSCSTLIDERNKFGDSILSVACVNESYDCIDILIDKGADINAIDHTISSPFNILLNQFFINEGRIRKSIYHG